MHVQHPFVFGVRRRNQIVLVVDVEESARFVVESEENVRESLQYCKRAHVYELESFVTTVPQYLAAVWSNFL